MSSDRRKKIAEQFKQDQTKHKKLLKDTANLREAKKMLMKVAPAFGLPEAQLRKVWYDSEEDMEIFRDHMEGTGMEYVYLCHSALDAPISKILKITEHAVWYAFIEATKEVEEPVLLFKIKRFGYFVMTNKRRAQELPFHARIRIPVKGTSAEVEVLPLELFIQENCDG